MKRYAIHTLGCKVNFAESSTIGRALERAGYQRVAPFAEAEIYVVNSCSVTEHADKKCRNIVRRLHRINPQARIAVTGCYAQLSGPAIAAIDGVCLVVGNNDKEDLPRLLLEPDDDRAPRIYGCRPDEIVRFFPAFSCGDRTRSFLKVQDGCDYCCSYCTIHAARGKSRNQPIANLVREAEQIAASGVREIVLTGVNTGDFGRTTGERFIDLLRALDRVTGIERYRISSIEPNLLTDEIIAFCASSPRFQPHFHIPLQSGSDEVLKRMQRRYLTAAFADRIAAVRRAMPDAFLGIDVIVGFPGESEADFEQTCRFLTGLAPAYLHVFPFSERPGTPAVDFPDKVPHAVITDRAAKLDALCRELHESFCTRYTGRVARVLFESSAKRGKMFGFTENYIRVQAPYDRRLVNRICRVQLGGWDESDQSLVVESIEMPREL